MKKKICSFLSMLLVLCMLASMMISTPVLAADESAAPTANGEYTEEGWAVKGDGKLTYTIAEGTEDETAVSLSKTAKKVGENIFEITLQVETHTNTTVETAGGAVVLVIDVSGSMDFCANCGAEGRSHSDSCDSATRQSRMAAAKAAALDFLETYAGTDASANRQLAIVTFETNYKTYMDWVNVAGGTGTSGYEAAEDKIENLRADGGTNLEGGLYEALNNLSDDAVKEFDAKNVILLTDGVPTYRIDEDGKWDWDYSSTTDGDGSNGSEANNAAAAKQATAIKKAGATLYTVCFGVADQKTYEGGPTVGNFLSASVASNADCAYNANNTSELLAAFKAISEDIVSGLDGKGWYVTDPMAAGVTVTSEAVEGVFTSDDNQTYTWTLTDAETTPGENGVTNYVYTYTYKVSVDFASIEGYEEGEYHPTNGPTFLNVDGKTYAFPVPGVQGTLPRTSVTATKIWDDANDQDGVRPPSITLQLMKDSVAEGAPVILDSSETTYKWDDLIEKSSGKTHEYTVKELNVDEDYRASYSKDGLTITNIHIPEKTEVKITKIWDDANNQDGKRPTSITVRLLADGKQVGEAIVLNAENADATDSNKWTYTVTGLDKYANKGQPVEYTVEEVNVGAGYTPTYSDDKLIVTNTHTPEVKDVTVTKIWDDANNQDGKRPASVTINLLANGKEVNEVILTADNAVEGDDNQWSYTFEGVAKYANTKEIVYTISEDAIEKSRAYTAEYSEDKLTVTNKHVPEVVTLAGTKTWDDNDNANGMRPESVTIRLKANGEEVDSVIVTKETQWTYQFEDLPVYKEGTPIEYTIIEDAVEDYTPEIVGMDVTNQYTPGVTSVSVTKVWDDADNQDGVRLNEVEIQLLANGKEVEGKTLILSEGNDWTDTFTNLPVKMNMEEVTYTVKEVTESGVYTAEIVGDATEGYTVINTHTPEVTTISGTKIWEDNNNQDGKRPESITVRLLADGKEVASAEVTEATQWTYVFEDQPVFKAGEAIVYSVTEDAVEDYSTTYAEEGYDIVNTHTPEKTSVTVTKVWEDADDQDGIRPDSITVYLFADGIEKDETVVLNAENKWTASFTGLSKFAAGEEIEYTVREAEVKGYKSTVSGDAVEGFKIINIHEPATVEVAGTKTWKDNNNQDGKRPESITVNLIANGEKIDSVEVTEADGWAYKFENLPKFEAGEEIAYAVIENAVEGYTVTVDGYNLTNSYTPELTSVTVTKNWQDTNDKDGIRPDSITVRLLANGKDTGLVMKLTAEYKWVGMFAELPAYENGKKIEYTVTEDAVKDYNTVITGSAEKGFEITNSHTSVPKTGDDNNITLYASAAGVSVVALLAMAVILKKKKSEEI